MNLPDSLLDPGLQWLGWGLFAAALLLALWRAPWQRLGDSTQSNVWLGTVVFLTLLWSIKAGVLPGLNLHLLGAMVFTLEFGPWLAFVGLSLVLAGITVNGAAGWESYGLNALLMAGLPVLLAQLIHRFNFRRLSHNPFVFIFANGFFGAALTVLGCGLAATLLLAGGGAYPLDKLLEDYLPYFLLLSFAEAWLSGMIVTILVVYRPGWIAAFDDDIYLANK